MSVTRDVLDGSGLSVDPQSGLERELAELRATCRRQALAIEALTSVVSALRRSTAALTEENRELRARVAGRHRSNGV